MALVAPGWDLWVSLEPDGHQVPALSLTFPNPKVTRMCPSSGGILQLPPGCWGQARGPTGMALLGCPQGMGTEP